MTLQSLLATALFKKNLCGEHDIQQEKQNIMVRDDDQKSGCSSTVGFVITWPVLTVIVLVLMT